VLRVWRIAVALSLSCLLGACSTTRVTLTYVPDALHPAEAGAAGIAVGEFVDRRGESASWLGAIRGGYGAALKTIETQRPLAGLV
jgi:hypothetical protein